MIGKIGVGYVTVCKIEFRRTDKETGERLHENGRFRVAAVKEDTRHTGRTHITQIIIMSGQSVCKVRVLEMMVGGICRNDSPVAQLIFDTPHI